MANRTDLPAQPGYFWLRGIGQEPVPVEVGWEKERDPDFDRADKGVLVLRRFGTAEQTPLDELDPDDALTPLLAGTVERRISSRWQDYGSTSEIVAAIERGYLDDTSANWTLRELRNDESAPKAVRVAAAHRFAQLIASISKRDADALGQLQDLLRTGP